MRDVRRIDGGRGLGGGQEKEWMGCFLDDLRAFGINADQWTTAAQDAGEWRRTAEQGAERFMAKWIAAEKARAGLRHTVVYPNVTRRSKKRIAQSKHTSRALSLRNLVLGYKCKRVFPASVRPGSRHLREMHPTDCLHDSAGRLRHGGGMLWLVEDSVSQVRAFSEFQFGALREVVIRERQRPLSRRV